jgi:hypothetical protein
MFSSLPRRIVSRVFFRSFPLSSFSSSASLLRPAPRPLSAASDDDFLGDYSDRSSSSSSSRSEERSGDYNSRIEFDHPIELRNAQEEQKRRSLKPSALVAELDKHVIGQTEAKKAVAIALRNRWQRHFLPKELKDEVMPKNILLVGVTGCGKKNKEQ